MPSFTSEFHLLVTCCTRESAEDIQRTDFPLPRNESLQTLDLDIGFDVGHLGGGLSRQVLGIFVLDMLKYELATLDVAIFCSSM